MKCERCGGKKTVCNYEHPEGSEYCLKCKTCPDCRGTDTKPEPEQDERLGYPLAYEEKYIVFNKKYIEKLDPDARYHVEDILADLSYYIGTENKYYVCNQDEPYAEDVISIILGKSGYTSSDAEIEAMKAKIESMREMFWDCICDAESIYDKWFALERNMLSEPIRKENYFNTFKDYLRQLDKEN